MGEGTSGFASSAAEIRLAAVCAANRDEILALKLDPSQVAFVASNSASLEEADDDEDARPCAVMAGERLVGFLMYEAPEDDDEARIYRLMIDRSEQGKGYGKAAMYAALAEIRGLGHITQVSICYEPENVAARKMYGDAGFIEEGLDEDGEMIARLVWQNAPA